MHSNISSNIRPNGTIEYFNPLSLNFAILNILNQSFI